METNFTTLDWIIVVVYLVGTVFIGFYARRYIRDMADYVVAGRSLGSCISIATMLGSEIGLVTVMYMSQKGFTGGFAAFHIGVAAGAVCLIVGLTGFLVVPLREAGVMTIAEFYGRRYGQGVRVLGGILLVLAGILNMGVFLKAGGLFVTTVTGLDDPNAVNIVMTVMIVLVLIYTVLGGMVSVVITDYVQFVVLSLGLLLACFFGLREVGWSNLVETVETVHGESGFNPFHEEGFGVPYVLWTCFTWGLVSCAVWPPAVMRALAARDTKVVKRLYAWSSVGFMTRSMIPQFLGICALAFLWQQLGAGSEFFQKDGQIQTDSETLPTLRAMPTLLSQILPAGVIGIIAAGMLAAFMSTHDSYLLCWASVMVEDIVNPLTGNKLGVRRQLFLARAFIVLIAAFLLVWSLWYPLGQDMLDYLAVSGAIYFTGAFAVLLFGLYWRRASRVGAYLALASGGCATLGLKPVQRWLNLTKEELGFEITVEYVGLGTVSLAVVLMVVGSLLFPDASDAHWRNDQRPHDVSS